LQSAFDNAPVASMCWKINIPSGANGIKIAGYDETSRATGSRFGGVQGYWLEEAGEKTASKPAFRQIELSLNKLIGLCYATDEVLMDATALKQSIRRAFIEEISFQVDNAIINGTGAGQPLGIINGGSTVEVSKESGQAAATIVWENIPKMWSRLLPKSQRTAVWLVHQSVMPQLYSMSLAVGTGGAPVYMPAGQASTTPYSTLFGRPVIPIEQCQALGTAGDIILADLKNGYVLADKGNVQEDVSIHVRFICDESVFRFVYRVDG
jgi:HK97 family phage major capsid protein